MLLIQRRLADVPGARDLSNIYILRVRNMDLDF